MYVRYWMDAIKLIDLIHPSFSSFDEAIIDRTTINRSKTTTVLDDFLLTFFSIVNSPITKY
jgi:hypothetical protein